MRTVSILRWVVVGLALLAATRAEAQRDKVIIDVETKARRGLYPIAVPMPVDGDLALGKVVTEVQTFNLGVSSWFRVLDPRSFLADLKAEGSGIVPQRWKDVGAFGVVKTRVLTSGDAVTIEFKLYEVEKGARPVLEREYRGTRGDVRKLVHRWSNDVVRHFTGEDGFFGSRITFVSRQKGNRQVMVMDFDGHGVRRASNNSSINILPAFSPDGAWIAFTSYMRNNPDLYVTPTGGGRARRVTSFPGMNTGATWSPDGSQLALTLSRDGNPEIYVVRAKNGSIVRRLTNNRYIDTSPAWSPDGREIAFVSDREGGPQIFVMNADGSNVRRIPSVSNHNQTPAWCPRRGTRLLAYTARDDVSGNYDIVTVDLDTRKMTRITQKQGYNEEPTWAPNCRVIAFSSTRKGQTGIWLANADGTGEQRQIHRGTGVTSPDWGPVKLD
jgi:TolB protein